MNAVETEQLNLRADARRNRERILDGARAVFAERGLEGQIDDVARRAEVGVGTVYRHFPTKEALLAELVRQKFRVLADNARRALERDGDPGVVVHEFLLASAQAAASDVALQNAVSGVAEHLWQQAAAEQRELTRLTQELLDRAQHAGRIRPDVTAVDVGMLMCGVCSTMAIRGEGFDWRRHLELVMRALQPG